ncbi:MAG: TIR domain-containing protein [Pyrinomonadaceae bacterium]|nr:TIR domain-containing protein [Pyrinomonadaceae bacterium]
MEYLTRSLRAFLCHSSGDKPAVRALYKRLVADGISPWLDEVDLLPGQDWQHEISKAVRNSDVVITCLSRNSISKRGFVQKEIQYALDVAKEQPEGTIFLIPLKLEECDIPDGLSDRHCVNLFEEGGYERLKLALEFRAQSLDITTEKYAQRLPIYLLIDCSRSLEGEPVEAMRQGVMALMADLQSDPQALETAWISIITFASDAWTIVPLRPIYPFTPPRLFVDVEDKTALGAALKVLNEAIDREVVRKTENHPGDFCPLVFVMIDGDPTDDWSTAARLLIERRNPKVNVIFCAAGPAVDIGKLKAVVPESILIELNNLQPDALKAFFKWIEQ